MIRWESALVVGVVIAVAASCSVRPFKPPRWDRKYDRDQARSILRVYPAIYRDAPLDSDRRVRVL